MGIFKKSKGGIIDTIRCDEQSYLIWKWHPIGTVVGESNRENSIRWGSSLRVKNNEIAVFVYKQSDGTIMDYIIGPYDGFLETANLPIIAPLISTLFGHNSPFQAEIYFINLSEMIQMKFGVPFFDVFDPRFDDFGVPVATHGSMTFKIVDYRGFVNTHRLESFSVEQFKEKIKDVVVKEVKRIITNLPMNNNIPVLQIERYIEQINDLIKENLERRMFKDYCISLTGFDLSSIDVDKESEGYYELKRVTKDVMTANVITKNDIALQNMSDMQRINAEDYAENLRIRREENQYATRLGIQEQHFATHQLNQQTAIGIAAADSLSNNNVNGFNPASMMAGIAIGDSFGKNIVGVMNESLDSFSDKKECGLLPPPIPKVAIRYYIIVDGNQDGPLKYEEIKNKIEAGLIDSNTYVWKSGLADWKPASEIPELTELF